MSVFDLIPEIHQKLSGTNTTERISRSRVGVSSVSTATPERCETRHTSVGVRVVTCPKRGWTTSSWPEEMEKTEMIGSGGAVIKTHSGVEFTGSSGNRLLDDALVDRTLESVVTVVLGIPMEISKAHWKSAFSQHHVHTQ